jgi:hypothetical protein
MKKILIFSIIAGLIMGIFTPVLPQAIYLNLDVYKDFMSAHEDISPSELFELYPSDVFIASVPDYDISTVLFLDEMKQTYGLTMDEMTLLMKHGFVVSERLTHGSFFGQFVDIYKADLPVFVSTDAILHAFHLSYDELLKQVELAYLIPELKKLLGNAHSHLEIVDKKKYGALEDMKPMLHDADVYLSVARRLLGDPAEAFYSDNETVISEYLAQINAEQMESVLFFSESMEREIDFSQFKPRGHYEEDWHGLSGYFQTMMWLGRMKLYLDHPDYYDKEEVRATVHRQIVDAVLLHELLTMEGNEEILEGMEEIISFFVGEQDNVSPMGMKKLLVECNIHMASELLDESNIGRFLDSLRIKPFAGQQILSQVFLGNTDGTSRSLPFVFMPFGQRFVIDSYVTGQVVYDRIIHEGENICRLVPSTLDIMFALGNDASLQLLIPELQKWDYSDNLAGLRFLIDQYGDEFWESSLYNLWLHAIESLNPDPGNEDLPEFMKTAAWGLEKLNTQLASWSELRHDNLLYAKQSYTSGNACSHPEGYVEPNPEFFERMKRLTEIAGDKFEEINEKLSEELGDSQRNPVYFFQRMYEICDTLEIIANKELSGEKLTDAECRFFDDISFPGFGGSGSPDPSGWYVDLIYYRVSPNDENLVVADYHTTPTDCVGNPLGWVLHAGTGLPDLAIVVATLANGELCAFTGPVASYHEYTTSGFLRLTDSEWVDEYLNESYRPDWVYNYLADKGGDMQDPGSKYYTDIDELYEALHLKATSQRDRGIDKNDELSIVPNPMEYKALISIKIPNTSQGIPARLSIYDLTGRIVRTLIDGPVLSGYFITEWDGNNETGSMVPPGSFVVLWEQGTTRLSEKIIVTR